MIRPLAYRATKPFRPPQPGKIAPARRVVRETIVKLQHRAWILGHDPATTNCATGVKCIALLHFLPGYAPELNPDELVWNYMKRTGTARSPLAKGESLHDRIDTELLMIQRNPDLVRSFFRAENVSYISD